MKISHISITPVFSNKTEIPKTYKISKEQTNSNLFNYPVAYGNVNIPFCARTVSKKTKKVDEEKQPEPDHNLPIFNPYAIAIFDIVKELGSQKPCFIKYNDVLDSKEILLDNLRSVIDTNKLSSIGLERNKPFLNINLHDYSEDYSNIFINLNKDINRSIKTKTKPILIVEGCRALFNTMERPFDFVRSSIFKKYPTIFMLEEGFALIFNEESRNYSLGFMPRENRPSNEYFDEFKFDKTRSKLSIINNFGHDIIYLPQVDNDSAAEYLSKPVVQKELLGRGKDVCFDKEAINFAILMGKTFAYNKDDLYNIFLRGEIIEKIPVALPETISLLRRAVVFSILKGLNLKKIDETVVVNSFPEDLDWINIYQNYIRIFEASHGIENEDSAEETENKDNKTIDNEIEEKTKNDDENISKITFDDIGGMYNIKKQLKEEFIDILKNPNVNNSQKPSGILLSGPPGCGKTLLAKAIAGETQVPFISTAGSSFVEVYVGVGAKRVRELYSKARKAAEEHPSKTAIVFIDEVDAVAGSRKNGGSNSEDLRTVNALLHEMDGANNKDDNDIKIITIVATNHEDMLDDAFKRSGRIDLKYTIDDPRYSAKARAEIIKIHSKNLKFSSEEEKENLLNNLAKSSAGMSGADLAELLKKADRMSMRIGRKENYVTAQDIAEAKMQVLAGVKTDIEHTEYELRQTIARTAGYAINAMVLQKVFEGEKNKHKVPSRVLDFITNSSRGKSLGSVYYKPSPENKTKSKETCLADVIMLYGGYATESSLFDTHSSAIDEDLKAATDIIEDAVSNSDFGTEKHYLSLTSNLTKSLFAQEIKDDMQAFSKKGMEISKTIISFVSPFIESYVEDIVENGEYDNTISSEEFKNKFNDWLTKNDKQIEFLNLCSEVKARIDEFCGEKERPHSRLGFIK